MTVGASPKVAVVGVGRWGRNHLAKLATLLGPERVGFYDVEAERARAARELCPGVTELRSGEEFLASDFGAAVVAAPAARHASLAREALAAGKDLLVEKPLALTPADAAGLVRLAEEREAVLMVGHILLFDPACEALKEAVDAGELGEIKYVTAARAKLGTIRVEEDVMFSLAAHDVALAIWLLGEGPTAASAVEARGAGPADAAFINLSFPSGATAHVWASWLYPVPTRRFVVVGDKAMAAVVQENRGRGELTIHKKGARAGREGPEVYDDGSRVVSLPDVDLLEAELRHFLSCLTSRARPRADGRQGLAVVKVLAAAQKSAEGGGAPVVIES